MSGAAPKRKRARRPAPIQNWMRNFGLVFLLAATAGVAGALFLADHTITLRTPIRILFQSPLVITPRMLPDESRAAQADQFGHRLTAFQQYACNRFGSA